VVAAAVWSLTNSNNAATEVGIELKEVIHKSFP
jgi:hypothetical protein